METNHAGSSWCCASHMPLLHRRGSLKPDDQAESSAGGTGNICRRPLASSALLFITPFGREVSQIGPMNCSPLTALARPPAQQKGADFAVVLPNHQDSSRTEVRSRFCSRCFTANDPSRKSTCCWNLPIAISQPQASFPGSSSIPLSSEQRTEVAAMPHFGRAWWMGRVREMEEGVLAAKAGDRFLARPRQE